MAKDQKKKKKRLPPKVNGTQFKAKLSVKQRLTSEMHSVVKHVTETDKRISKLSFAVGRDISTLEGSAKLQHELFWGLVESLISKGAISSDEIDVGRKIVTDRWHEEQLNSEKEELHSSLAMCIKCFHKSEPGLFLDEENGGFKCSRCFSTDDPYFKEDESDSESNQAVP